MAQVLIDRLEVVDVIPAKDLLAPLASVCVPRCKSLPALRTVQYALHRVIVACLSVLQPVVRAPHDGNLLLVVEAILQQLHADFGFALCGELVASAQ